MPVTVKITLNFRNKIASCSAHSYTGLLSPADTNTDTSSWKTGKYPEDQSIDFHLLRYLSIGYISVQTCANAVWNTPAVTLADFLWEVLDFMHPLAAWVASVPRYSVQLFIPGLKQETLLFNSLSSLIPSFLPRTFMAIE